MTQSFDPARHLNGAPVIADVVEGRDAPYGINTPYKISVNDSFSGEIESIFDTDWVEVTFTAGATYTINMSGSWSGGGSLTDAYLSLRDSSGTLIAYDDDGGAGMDSSLTFTATSTGSYFLEASAFGAHTGSYILSIDTAQIPPIASLDELANYLTDGYWGGRQYTWDTSISNTITVNITGLTPETQQLARWAMQSWEMVADISFQEVSGWAQITMDDRQAGASATPPNGSASVNIGANWAYSYGTSLDTYLYQSYVHELGHALGLGHQGDYNSAARYGTDALFANDSWHLSVMSYFSQSANTSVHASYAYLAGAQRADIVAIQSLYGAPDANSATAGDTTYGVASSLGNYMDAVYDWFTSDQTTPSINGARMAWTIYDLDGTDHVDFSTVDEDTRLDLRPNRSSDFGTHIGAMSIARGTTLENASTGAGDDRVVGNSAANSIDTGAGDDRIWGFTGNDTIEGGAGFDTLRGNSGDDSLDGGEDEDRLQGGWGDDTLLGGEGSDRVYGDPGNDVIFGDHGNDVLRGGRGDDWLAGEAGADRLRGGSGSDSLFGGEEDDRLNGQSEDDYLEGGLGHDSLFGGSENDVILGQSDDDILYGNRGDDTVYGGSGDDRLWGGNHSDHLEGGAGDDTLGGGSGADTLIGGAGNDGLMGGSGADLYVFELGADDDVIYDFNHLEGDSLQLNNDLWSGLLSVNEIVSDFGRIDAGSAVLEFTNGDSITLRDIDDLSLVSESLTIFEGV